MTLKKSALAVAIATIIAGPAVSSAFAADQSWSGRVHWRLEVDDNEGDGEDMSLAGAGHRIAVRGSGDANNGNKVGYHIEGEIQNESQGRSIGSSRGDGALEWRHTNVYYGGDWGTVTVGRQNNPYNQVYKSDVFERNSGTYELAASFRIGDAIVYSGDFGAFGFFAGAVIDGQSNDDGEDADSTVVGANFNIGKSVAITVANQSTSEDGVAGADASLTGIGAQWSAGALTVAGWFEDESEAEITVIDVGVWYSLGDTTVGGDYSTQEIDDPDETRTRIMLGVYHNLGGGADIYGEYGDESYDENDDLDNNNITIGYRVKFN